ncbi:class IV lanthionine synthetase LanL [Streptomyces sp.]|uniref:class IV lanthionine synthetase LanL n=1 Tax=Streptomyces sp. TaxID=1931 RepID=UPI002D782AD9|nr:class IV lanthionine synthetase LanL [Streptomyces sp.]HET6355941.1 class IV lanthionine synthetase LanL [Streptomyces sp.]
MDPMPPRDTRHTGDDAFLVDVVESVFSRHRDEGGAWRVRPGDFWCYVSPADEPTRVQGWKLHISATPLSAPLILSRTAHVLVRRRCRFKFASTLGRAAELVSHRHDRGGGGKFLTVYPECDDDGLRALAEELHRATEGLPGPGVLSDRPCFPGSLVHYRYGVFSGVQALGDDGVHGAMLIAPDGTLVRDQRKPWFSPPPWAPRDPFAVEQAPVPRKAPAAASRPAPKPVLLDGRYLVHEVIRHAFAGGVYRATDQTTGAPVIVKQARPHTAATLTGQDVRDRRRHEAAMLDLFAESGYTPRPVGVFEQQNDLFLVQEAVPGTTLRQWVLDHLDFDDGSPWGIPLTDAMRLARGLTSVMRSVHAAGWVLRDFNPNNTMIDDSGDVRLIDLEMLARPGEPTTRIYTPGYAGAEQLTAPGICAAPRPASDLYSLGATLFYLVTGVDPLLAADAPATRPYGERLAAWLVRLSSGNMAAHRLAPLILDLLQENPELRPDTDEVLNRLAGTAVDERPPSGPVPVRDLADRELKQLVSDGLDHLLATMDPEHAERLWPTGPVGAATDAFNVQHGAAGVVGVLVRAYADEPQPGLRAAVEQAARWIGLRVGREPRTLPGLYYGRSGTAWALLDAAVLLGDAALLAHAKDLAVRVPVRWPGPDICHGVAGAGMTQLRFWEATGEERFLDRARQAADHLSLAAVRKEGSIVWPVPGELLSSPSDITHYGFAHGGAGIGAFLLAVARATGTATYGELAAEAARSLLSLAEVEKGAAYWRSGEKGSPRKTHWCSGSSGVGTFLVRMWQETGEDAFREAAHGAAVAVRRSRWHVGTAQCHGLAGDGEFLLDLAEACGTDAYREWAGELAAGIHVRHVLRDGRVVLPDDGGTEVWADFNTGLSGVLAFLLRYAHGGPRLWQPRSFTGHGDEDSGTAAAQAAAVPAHHHRTAERG